MSLTEQHIEVTLRGSIFISYVPYNDTLAECSLLSCLSLYNNSLLSSANELIDVDEEPKIFSRYEMYMNSTVEPG
jgi:hypothetical protein